MFINPNASRVVGGEASSPQDTPSSTASRIGSSPQPGQGGLQGTMVSVGEGGTAALRDDAAQSRGWFGGVFSALWQAAEDFTTAMHGDPLEDEDSVHADSDVQDDVRSEVDEDDTLTEVDDDDEEFFDCDDDGVAAYNARQQERQAVSGGPTGQPQSLDDVPILPLSSLLGDVGEAQGVQVDTCLLYTSPSPRDS